MNENQISEMVEDVLDDFDFHKVMRVMHFLEWEWVHVTGVPTMGDLRRQARRLLRTAISGCLQNDTHYVVGCGGFRAEAWSSEDEMIEIRLAFELESSIEA